MPRVVALYRYADTEAPDDAWRVFPLTLHCASEYLLMGIFVADFAPKLAQNVKCPIAQKSNV